MKRLLTSICILLIPTGALFSQVTGNVAYRDSDRWKLQAETAYQQTHSTNDPDDIVISVNCLYNAQASGYLAIFHLTQTAGTARECDSLMTARISGFLDELDKQSIEGVEVLTDMLSFVPVYSVEVSRKFLSKTYHEIPAGFEMQKNLHVKYKDPILLDAIITSAAFHEIFDLVKVEYFVENADEIYAELEDKAMALLEERKATWKDLGIDVGGLWQRVRIQKDAFYPLERYTSYQTKTRPYIKKKNGEAEEIEEIPPVRTLYYNTLAHKSFDIVFNPEFIEPPIQYTYFIEVKFDVEKPEAEVVEKEVLKEVVKTEVQKQFILISPDGNVKELNL